jgi:hypothetical protein
MLSELYGTFEAEPAEATGGGAEASGQQEDFMGGDVDSEDQQDEASQS